MTLAQPAAAQPVFPASTPAQAAQPVFPSPTPAPSQAAQPVFPAPAPAQVQQPASRQDDLATVTESNFQPLPPIQAQGFATPVPAAPTPAPSQAAWQVPQPAAPTSGFQSQAPAQFSAPPAGFAAQIPTAYGVSGVGSQPPASFPPATESPRQRGFLSRPVGRIVLVVLALVVIGGGVGAFFLLRGGSSTAVNPPSDVPLPTNSTFVKKVDQTWYYTVANTTSQQIQNFYQTQLPQKGWQEPNILGSTGSTVVISCKSNQEVEIVSDASAPLGGVSPPGGGVVLKIVLQPPAQADCALQ